MAPLMLFLIIAKTKEKHILVKIIQYVWRMDMSLSFHKRVELNQTGKLDECPSL